LIGKGGGEEKRREKFKNQMAQLEGSSGNLSDSGCLTHDVQVKIWLRFNFIFKYFILHRKVADY